MSKKPICSSLSTKRYLVVVLTKGLASDTPNSPIMEQCRVNTVTKLGSISAAASTKRQSQLSKTDSNTLFKTELCEPYMLDQRCKFGDCCKIAHGLHELNKKE